jgi:hypothetical protein
MDIFDLLRDYPGDYITKTPEEFNLIGSDIADLLYYLRTEHGLLMEGNVWLAGSSLLHHMIDSNDALSNFDFDFFFKNQESYDKWYHVLASTSEDYIDMEHSVMFKIDGYEINLIKAFLYEDVEQLLNSFDISVSRIAFDGHKVYLHDLVMPDINVMKMQVLYISNPLTTFGRLLKYVGKGFSMKESSIIHFLNRTRDFNLTNFKHKNDEYADFLEKQLWRD